MARNTYGGALSRVATVFVWARRPPQPMEGLMQITALPPPINGGTLFCGVAVTKQGRRHSFCSTLEGDACCVFREDPTSVTDDGRTFWEAVKAPLCIALCRQKGGGVMKPLSRRSVTTGLAAAVTAIPALGLSVAAHSDPLNRIKQHTRELERAMRDCYGAEVKVLTYGLEQHPKEKPMVLMVPMEWFVQGLRRYMGLDPVRRNAGLDPFILGPFERFLAFSLAVFDVPGIATVLAAWIAAKLAASWQRFKIKDDKEGRKVRIGTMIALMAGVVSVGTGVIAGRLLRSWL